MTEAVSKLLKTFAHMQPEFDEDLKVLGSDFPNRSHSVYGQLFNPYIIEVLKNDADANLLQNIFSFVEELASSVNPDDENLVAVTICECLGGEEDILARAREFMGPLTLKLSRDIEIFWGRENA